MQLIKMLLRERYTLYEHRMRKRNKENLNVTKEQKKETIVYLFIYLFIFSLCPSTKAATTKLLLYSNQLKANMIGLEGWWSRQITQWSFHDYHVIIIKVTHSQY